MSDRIWRDAQTMLRELAREHGAAIEFGEGGKHKAARVVTADGRFFKLSISTSPRASHGTQLKVIRKDYLRNMGLK